MTSMIRYTRPMMGNPIASRTGLTEDQMRKFVPAIFADAPGVSRSSRYGFIPTIEIVNSMRGMGFLPTMACQTRARSDDAREAARHVIRFSHPDAKDDGENKQEVVLLNSHDGSSSYQLLTGIYRMVCSNGLIAGDTHSKITVRHTSRAAQEVGQASLEMIQGADGVWDVVKAMQEIPMSQDGLVALGEAAAQLVHPDVEIDGEDMADWHRHVDNTNPTLWTGLNRVQENAIRGGVRSIRRTDDGPVIARTRAINSVNRSVEVNQNLWTLAEMVLSRM